MEQYTLKNVNKCLKTNIYSYFETSGVQSFNLYVNVVHFSALAMEQHALKNYKQLFEYQHLLLLRDIWWAKF
jgi:hypothetical protein